MKNQGFYGDESKYDFDRSLKYYKIPVGDAQLLKEYLDEKQAVDHISERRTRKIGFTLIGWRRFIKKQWQDCTLPDILAGITKLKTSRAIKFKRNGERYEGQPLSPTTQYDFVIILKPYLLWLREKGILNIPEKDLVKKVKPPRAPDPSERIKPEDLLTKQELLQLVKAAHTDRDRALIYSVYESGARVGEIGRLTWNDLVFDEYGVKMYIEDAKTHKRRYSRIVECTEYLATLKANRLGPLRGDGFVFLNDDGTPITRITVVRALERAAKHAGIEKPVNPHALRHARATHMVNAGYQESHIKKSLWGNLNTKMFKTYVSLGERDIDAEFLKQAGIVVQDQKNEDKLKPITCSNCHHINAPGPDHDHCTKCGWPLTKRAADEMQQAREFIHASDEYQRALEEQRQREAMLMKRIAALEAAINK